MRRRRVGEDRNESHAGDRIVFKTVQITLSKKNRVEQTECFPSISNYSFLLVLTAAGVFACAKGSIVCLTWRQTGQDYLI